MGFVEVIYGKNLYDVRIVAANRCTDRTAAIARHYGAKVLENNVKCIAAVRNSGVYAADRFYYNIR